MLSESLSGISTIRANNALEYFQEKFRLVHDAHGEDVRTFYTFIIHFLFMECISHFSSARIQFQAEHSSLLFLAVDG